MAQIKILKNATTYLLFLLLFVQVCRAAEEEKQPLSARARAAFVKMFTAKKEKESNDENQQALHQEARKCCIGCRQLMEFACSRSFELTTYCDDNRTKQQLVAYHEKGRRLTTEISDSRIYTDRSLKEMMQLVCEVEEYVHDYVGSIPDAHLYSVDCIGNVYPFGVKISSYPITGQVACALPKQHFPILDRLADLKADYDLFTFRPKKTLKQKLTPSLLQKKQT